MKFSNDLGEFSFTYFDISMQMMLIMLKGNLYLQCLMYLISVIADWSLVLLVLYVRIINVFSLCVC